jgi:4a-hydroxytetrahydrobiopterin dehydratase
MDQPDDQATAAALAALPDWTLEDRTIRRTLAFRDFAGAMRFVNCVADLAEAADHHPDIEIRWNKVTLRLTTHSCGDLTGLDFDLAARIDQIT